MPDRSDCLECGNTAETYLLAAVFVPTRGGATTRSITRFRLPAWIVGISADEATCRQLQFSYGMYPEWVSEHPDNWKEFIATWLYEHQEEGRLLVVTEGPPSRKHPDASHRIEIIDLYGNYLQSC